MSRIRIPATRVGLIGEKAWRYLLEQGGLATIAVADLVPLLLVNTLALAHAEGSR